MANNCPDNESPVSALKSESARKRWEMFHRAIAHAKRSTTDAMQEEDCSSADAKHGSPALTIVR